MKQHLFAKLLAVCGIILCGGYLVLMILSKFVSLPFAVGENVLFADWAFIAVPIVGLISAIALQIASNQK